METTMIADAVEETRRALEWTDEAYALGGEVDCGWDDDDTRGWLRMGPVEVDWRRDPYGDGLEDWVAVSVSAGGEPVDADGYPHLSDAVRGAARTTAEWQHHCDGEILERVVEWLDDRDEVFTLDGPMDVHESWMILWGDVSVRGFYGEDDETFVWSVSSSESGDYLDGDASDDADAVIDAMIECAKDPMVEAFREEIEEATADDDWVVRTSDDGLTVSMSDPAYSQSRRAYYEAVGYGEGRIELEIWVSGAWRPFDERLPEDEADVHAMAREAYEWVKAVGE